MSSVQLVVIGAGPGGYAAAFHAADLGLKVALVDTELNPGGVCLYRGCIPSKALLHVAKIVSEARHASAWGVSFGEPKIDLDKLRAFKDSVVSKMVGGLGQLSKQRKITYIQGKAAFVDAKTLSIDLVKGGTETLSFEHAIIATGSRPAAANVAGATTVTCPASISGKRCRSRCITLMSSSCVFRPTPRNFSKRPNLNWSSSATVCTPRRSSTFIKRVFSPNRAV